MGKQLNIVRSKALKIVGLSGFSRTGATSLEMVYLQDELLEQGHKFKLLVFDNKKTKNIVGVSANKFMAFLKLFPKLFKMDFDVLLVAKASPYVGIPAIIISTLRRKPSVVILDDSEIAITTERHGRFAGLLMGALERMVINLSEGVISTCEFQFHKFKSDKMRLIPFGVPVNRFANAKNIRKSIGLKRDERVLIYVGSLTKNADVDIAIEAIQYIDAKLLVVGGGEAIGYFKQMAEDLGVGEKVLFVDKQPFDKVPDFIFSSDICLIPMRDTEMDKSRCPMKLLEYIAAEKPIVGGDVGMVKYFLKKGGGLLYKNGDIKDLAEKINELLKSKKLKEKCVKELRSMKKEYSWSKMSREFVKVLSEVSS
jgi:glycosyltransferase involved in cell wall biosynthesis